MIQSPQNRTLNRVKWVCKQKIMGLLYLNAAERKCYESF